MCGRQTLTRTLTLMFIVVSACWAVDPTPATAYERYNDGCADCHGAFDGPTSPTGSVFPSDSKHEMHRGATAMDTNCSLCHTTGDSFNPYIGSSDGTAANVGLGCVGCHGRMEDAGHDDLSMGLGAGLRQHHVNSGIDECAFCHSDADPADYTPVGEDVFPPYYGTIDTNADEPCNQVAEANINENWTIGDLLGLDNDGDLLYDTLDPDCAVNEAPIADPDGPYMGTVGVAVPFDGSGSSDPDGSIMAYDWDFGDGGTGTGVAPMYAYAAPGSYTVTLTVTDNDGMTDSATTTAEIQLPEPLPPTADPDGPYAGIVGESVQFDGSGSSDPDGTIVAYDWDFGDGGTATGVAPMYAYADPGTYTVTLTVTDNDGLTDTAMTTADIQVMPEPLPPIADPDGPYMGTAGVAVAFDGSGSGDPDGTIVAYDWDFGDGGTAAGVAPMYAYAAPGTYTVTLTVTDNDGLTDTAMTTADIQEMPEPLPPTADPDGPYMGTVGAAVQFDGSGSTDPDGTIVAYDWDFGDGGTGTGVAPMYAYAAPGAYTVTLTVTDNDGLMDTATTTADIQEMPMLLPPIADPDGPYMGTVGAAVAFDGSGSADPDGTIVAYDWDFGDGTFAIDAGPTPTHTYTAAGEYQVMLMVTDNDGLTDVASTTATIEGPPMQAVDLDIVRLRVTNRVKLKQVRPISIKLVIKNRGSVDEPRLAMVVGVQNGDEVYAELLLVSDPVGHGHTTIEFPPYQPTEEGAILWTAQIADDDPDLDEATATTTVGKSARRPEHSPVGSHGRHVGTRHGHAGRKSPHHH